MKKLLRNSLVSLCSASLLAACSQTYVDSQAHIEKTKTDIKTVAKDAEKTAPAVVFDAVYYVDTTAMNLDDAPAWLNKPVNVEARNIPLRILMSQVLQGTPVVPNFDDSTQSDRLVGLVYRGPLKGALDTLAAETNYAYVVHPHDIAWSAFETKTFDVSFMPGSSKYLVGQDANSTSQSSSSSSSNSPVDQINDQQYSNLQGQLSLWKDLEKTITQLKSKQGRVVVSESTTSVTVNDRPTNVRAVENYIQSLNATLTTQVKLQVQVLEINLSKAFNYGIDWNAVLSTLDTQIHITGEGATYANPLASSATTSGNTGLYSLGIGFGQTQTLINALNQQGQVRVVTEPEVVTMNNQIAAIRITTSVGYLASVGQTISQSFSTATLTPGSIDEGFTLYILPKIQNSNVYLQLSSTIATLDSMQSVSSTPSSTDSDDTSSQTETIQVPTVSQKSFNQHSLVESGSTLVIAGYKQLRDEKRKASFFGVDQLGGKGASTSNVETLVLITPTILHSNTS